MTSDEYGFGDRGSTAPDSETRAHDAAQADNGAAGPVPPRRAEPEQRPWDGEPRSANSFTAASADPAENPGEGHGAQAAPDAVAADSAGEDREAGQAPGSGRAKPKKRSRSAWRELPILIVVALVIALVIKTYVVQPFFIPTSSMEDTLMVGDKILVNKLVYHFRSIQPGDIVVFNGAGSWDPNPSPAKSAANPIVRVYDDTLRRLFDAVAGLFGTPVDQTDFVKRVIGVPGDRVACCNAQGLVTVNGVPLHEQSYLYPGAAPSTIRFNIVVPPGRLWVMGDNRAISDDSRLRQSDPGHGTIPESEVIGRAFLIVWPPSQWRILNIPSTFDQRGIDKAAHSAAARRAASTTAAELLGAPVRPSAPYLPMAVGLASAVPLTWLQRRARREVARTLRAMRARRRRDT